MSPPPSYAFRRRSFEPKWREYFWILWFTTQHRTHCISPFHIYKLQASIYNTLVEVYGASVNIIIESEISNALPLSLSLSLAVILFNFTLRIRIEWNVLLSHCTRYMYGAVREVSIVGLAAATATDNNNNINHTSHRSSNNYLCLYHIVSLTFHIIRDQHYNLVSDGVRNVLFVSFFAILRSLEKLALLVSWYPITSCFDTSLM